MATTEIVVFQPNTVIDFTKHVTEVTSDTVVIVQDAGDGAGGAVDSVNGQAGVVVLDAADVGADPAGTAAAVGAGKANTVHGHAIGDVSGLSAALADKAESVHGHAIAEIVGLITALAQVELNRLAILTKADQSDVAQQIADLVGTDQQILAVIQEIGAALADDQDLLDALEYTVANRVRFDVNNQSLTALQKSNARTNIAAEEIGVAAMLIAQITAASIGAATSLQGAKADTALQAADAPATVRDTPLTGLSTATASPITAADSVLSAAGKLQAQISAASGGGAVGGAYIAGRHYGNQKVGANLDTDRTHMANLLYLTPYYADSDVTITKWAVTPTSSQTGRQYKGAVYKVTNGSLIRITPEQLIGNSAIARVFFEQSFSLKKGELCFFAFLANGTSPYQCVNRTVALNIGSVNGVVGNTTLVTYLLIDTTFASGLADTYALAQTIEQINPPQHVVFQVA